MVTLAVGWNILPVGCILPEVFTIGVGVIDNQSFTDILAKFVDKGLAF